VKAHKFPDSSNIASVRYDNQVLTVQFKSKKSDTASHYRYTGVPEAVYKQLVDAPSVGSAFHTLIRSHDYPFTKVEWNLPKRDARGRFIKKSDTST
jgi:hypothetical protein